MVTRNDYPQSEARTEWHRVVRQSARGVEREDRKSVVEGKSVDLGGRRIIKKNFFQAEDGIRDIKISDWSSDVCSSDLSAMYVFWHGVESNVVAAEIGRASCRERV